MDFTSSVEDIDQVTKKVTVSIPTTTFEEKFKSALEKARKSVQIKGFRDGKAPPDLVERMYGERVRADVTSELIESSLNDAAKKHNLNIVGNPRVNLGSTEAGKPVEFTADVSIYPHPDVTGFEKFTVEVPKREVTDTEINNVVEYLRKNKATVKPLEGRTKLQKGDVANAEFIVTEDGGTPSKPEPYSFCLGEGQLPKEVEEALDGLSVGESREVTVGGGEAKEGEAPRKSVKYHATIKSLSERILPEPDDDFAKQIDPKVATMLELRLKIRESLEKQKKEEHNADVNDAVIKSLLAANKFEVPQVLIDDEIWGILERKGFVDPKKVSRENFPWDQVRKDLGVAAADRVRAAIIVDCVAEKAEIKVAKEDIDAAVQEVAAANNISPAEAQRHLFARDRAVSFMIETTRNKVLEFLRSKAEIKYKG